MNGIVAVEPSQIATVQEEVVMTDVCNRLAEVLSKKGMSLKDLERRTWEIGNPVSYQALQAIYHNRVTMMKLRVMRAICEATDTPIEKMFYFPGQSDNGKDAAGGG